MVLQCITIIYASLEMLVARWPPPNDLHASNDLEHLVDDCIEGVLSAYRVLRSGVVRLRHAADPHASSTAGHDRPRCVVGVTSSG